MRCAFAFLFAASLTACPNGPLPDAGPADGGPIDSGPGPVDGGAPADSGPPALDVPDAWENGHCSAAWYGDSSCDCGCLADDVDCPAAYGTDDCDFVLCPTGQALDPEDPAACVPACGDGRVADNEACDDGNVEDGDGCAADCTWEIPDTWADGCGAGTYGARDGCDCGCGAPDPDCADASIARCDHNRCDVTLDGPWVPDQADPTGCVLNTCGNSFPGEVETCDDGNTVAGDGCDAHCQVETGFVCTPGACAPSVCGDGLTDPWAGELCDDANSDDSDGCTAACTLAPPGLDAPLPGSCAGRCDEWLGRAPTPDGASCFCDDRCASLGDCCADLASVCRAAPPSCGGYCVSVMAACPDAYLSADDCEATCHRTGWGLGEPGALSGNSVACRTSWAAVAADVDAGVAAACAAAGPTGGGVCGALCDVLCDALDNNCHGDTSPFEADGGAPCALACPSLPSGGDVGDLAGDTLQCRLTWSQLPAEDDPSACVHAGPQGAACMAPLPVDAGPPDSGVSEPDAGVSDAG